MKTPLHIHQLGFTTNSTGSNGIYKCQVLNGSDIICEGLGSTPENAADTAYYGTIITLRK